MRESVSTEEVCCQLKAPGAMDCRVVLIFTCVLIAQAACVPVGNGETAEGLNKIINMMRKEIQTALGHLTVPGLLPNISCLTLNITELLGLKEEALTVQHLSSFRCYMIKLSVKTRHLSPQLMNISQYTQQIEQLKSDQIPNRVCSLPLFKQHMDSYVFVKCLLQLLDERLIEPNFDFTA